MVFHSLMSTGYREIRSFPGGHTLPGFEAYHGVRDVVYSACNRCLKSSRNDRNRSPRRETRTQIDCLTPLSHSRPSVTVPDTAEWMTQAPAVRNATMRSSRSDNAVLPPGLEVQASTTWRQTCSVTPHASCAITTPTVPVHLIRLIPGPDDDSLHQHVLAE